MNIRKYLKFARPESTFDKAVEQEMLSAWFELAQAVNKGLKFSDNFSADIIDVADTGLADAEFEVDHTLKRVPTGFLILNIDKAGFVYDSGTAWDTEKIYLKCNVASCAIKVMVL